MRLGAAMSALALSAGAASASDVGVGWSQPGQLDLQTPVTQVGRQILDLHHLMLFIITASRFSCFALLVIVIPALQQPRQ